MNLMSDCMTQEDAMNMSAEQAIQILKPMQRMMRDQHGCPISDAYFALGKALEALGKEPKWTPVKFRPMDEEERQYWEEHYGYKFDEEDSVTFDCPMPGDRQEVWVCSKCGNVWQDVCGVDEGTWLEENGDWDDIVAWMPFEKPKPYKGEEDG
jgi:hypothetical protein